MVAVLAAIFGIAATPLFKAADSPPIPARSRVGTLDGLRGFLALAVFFHHGALYHSYLQDHLWRPPPDRFYGLLGPLGVSVFFMITGFLFWSQVLDRRGKPDWVRLYVGRVFRIGPLYLAAVAAMVLAVFAVTGFHLRVPIVALARQLAEWGALGLTSGSPINGYEHPGVLLANVTWSLRWEWFYYASLIMTAVFARNRLTSWLLPAAGFAISTAVMVLTDLDSLAHGTAAFVGLFCIGMLTAALRGIAANFRFNTPVFSTFAAAIILVVTTQFGTVYGPAPLCLLGAAFFMIANGTTLFGLLSTRPARRLGDVSFGIYLLQGLVYSALFSIPGLRTFALGSPIAHWLLVTVAAVALVGLATIAHALIERPGVELGRYALERIRVRNSRQPREVVRGP
jgi:peptidoglycan/LPS O-acetylase OafA/YrhL